MSPVAADPTDVLATSQLFHALSDRLRLTVLLALLDGERRVADIVAAVGSSQSNVSNHLGCLKGCGLVVDRPGARRQVFYSIARPEVRDLLLAADRFLVEGGRAVRECRDPLMPPRPSRRGHACCAGASPPTSTSRARVGSGNVGG